MTYRYMEQERKAKVADPHSQSINHSTATNASHPLEAKYEPSRNLIRRAIISLPVGNSSKEVHQHQNNTLKSTINSQRNEKEIRTSSLSNTSNPPSVQPNIVFGSFPAQPNLQADQRFVVATTSRITSSPPHLGHGILGRAPPHSDHGILGCKPIGYIHQHALPAVVNNRSAMYNAPYYYSEYQHALGGEANKELYYNSIQKSQDGYHDQQASPQEINLQSYNVPNSFMLSTKLRLIRPQA